jgi:hypothetical protein
MVILYINYICNKMDLRRLIFDSVSLKTGMSYTSDSATI